MKTMQQWFNEYAVSHQNKTNQLIHYICVPVIFFSIVGMLMAIPSTFIASITNIKNPILENWAAVILIFVLLFYLKLSLKIFFKMLIFSLLCLLGNYYFFEIHQIFPLFYTSLALFVVAWIGQFYGHKIEGKKPSFFKDLQFLLIGPAWVFEKISRKI